MRLTRTITAALAVSAITLAAVGCSGTSTPAGSSTAGTSPASSAPAAAGKRGGGDEVRRRAVVGGYCCAVAGLIFEAGAHGRASVVLSGLGLPWVSGASGRSDAGSA